MAPQVGTRRGTIPISLLNFDGKGGKRDLSPKSGKVFGRNGSKQDKFAFKLVFSFFLSLLDCAER